MREAQELRPATEVLGAVENVFRLHHARAKSRCLREFGDDSLAEDAVQDAFLQLAQRAAAGDHFLLSRNPEQTIDRNTRWAAYKILRYRRRHAVTSLDEADNSSDEGQAWVQAEARNLIHQIMPRLSAAHRQVLQLRFTIGYDDAAAAAQLGITVKAFQSRCDRAIRAARQAALEMDIAVA